MHYITIGRNTQLKSLLQRKNLGNLYNIQDDILNNTYLLLEQTFIGISIITDIDIVL